MGTGSTGAAGKYPRYPRRNRGESTILPLASNSIWNQLRTVIVFITILEMFLAILTFFLHIEILKLAATRNVSRPKILPKCVGSRFCALDHVGWAYDKKTLPKTVGSGVGREQSFIIPHFLASWFSAPWHAAVPVVVVVIVVAQQLFSSLLARRHHLSTGWWNVYQNENMFCQK